MSRTAGDGALAVAVADVNVGDLASAWCTAQLPEVRMARLAWSCSDAGWEELG